MGPPPQLPHSSLAGPTLFRPKTEVSLSHPRGWRRGHGGLAAYWGCYLCPSPPASLELVPQDLVMPCLPSPTHLLGAVCTAQLVVDVRNHLQRPAQRRQGLPAEGQTSQAGSRQPLAPAMPAWLAGAQKSQVSPALKLG